MILLFALVGLYVRSLEGILTDPYLGELSNKKHPQRELQNIGIGSAEFWEENTMESVQEHNSLVKQVRFTVYVTPQKK